MAKIRAHEVKSPVKVGFVIFVKWATFWDFVDTRLLKFIPSGVQIGFRYSGGFFSISSVPTMSCDWSSFSANEEQNYQRIVLSEFSMIS